MPEHKPDLAKLGLYDKLRQIYVLGTVDIPYQSNPLNRPYLSVCKSTRCNAGRDWKSVHAALEQQLAASELESIVKLRKRMRRYRSSKIQFWRSTLLVSYLVCGLLSACQRQSKSPQSID